MPVPDDVLTSFWPPFRRELRNAVAEPTWELWLAPLEPRSLDGQTLVLEAPQASRAWVIERYGRLLAACAGAVLAHPVTVAIESAGDPPQAGTDGPPPRADGARRSKTVVNRD